MKIGGCQVVNWQVDPPPHPPKKTTKGTIMEATIIENDLASVTSAITIDQDAITDALARMTNVINESAKMCEECTADEETLASMEPADVKRLQQALNAKITEGKTALTDFNRVFDAPKKTVKAAYDKAVEPLTALQAAYKDQQVANEQREKDEKRAQLEAHFYEYAGVLDHVANYDQVHDDKWLNKGYALSKAFGEIETIVDCIARSWQTLKTLDLPMFDVAERTFFTTFDLDAAISAAYQAQEDHERIEALNAEQAEMMQQREEAKHEPEPEQNKPSSNDEPRSATVVIEAATLEQLKQLAEAMRNIGLHGTIKRG